MKKENKNKQSSLFSSLTPVVEAIDSYVDNICTPQGQTVLANLCTGKQSIVINNKIASQDLEPSVIPYIINQPADSQLQSGNFCPIFIFGINKYLKDNVKNITCLLYRITAFVRQQKLEDKTADNISQIAEFGFAVWNLLLAIYKLGQVKLAVSKNKTFRQSISLQFNKMCTNNMALSKLSSSKSTKEKKVDISRVPSPISSRPSKSILAKSKFYNINSSLLSNSKLYIKLYA